MNKTAIKKFAVDARKKLIDSVKTRAGNIGITENKVADPIASGEGFAIFPSSAGSETRIEGKELVQRANLVKRIAEVGYEAVIEEVAYTWFNRIIAIRFMEVNDYLPTRTRVLSSETEGKSEPDIVTDSLQIELELSQNEIEEILILKDKNDIDSTDKLFRMLFIKQCNELGKLLPELFENTSKHENDYTEILLGISWTDEDGVVRELLKIEEEDFLEAVEIIGWMYQYYNTDPKARVDAYVGKKKVPKEDVPAKTQLFTPDWIVRYMVENSVGRLWTEGHPNESLKSEWKYYLEEAEQEPSVKDELEKIRAEYSEMNPEDIKVLDPCMGSGHILVYAFEVLMQIYESCGYTQRDAARFIIENNIYGLDIDDRAYQLSYFAIMMKGRKYDRRFLTRGVEPKLCAIAESNSLKSLEGNMSQIKLEEAHLETIEYIMEKFKDAKEYGSILDVENRDYDGLLEYMAKLEAEGADDLIMSAWLKPAKDIVPLLAKQAKLLANKYDIVITNPPYFSSTDMSKNLSDYVKKYYPNSKSDMFAVFIEKGLTMSKAYGYSCMVTMQSWMFLSSYEKLRTRLIAEKTISNLMHMGNNVMGIAFGTAVVNFRNHHIKGCKGIYNRIDMRDIGMNDEPKEFPSGENRFNIVSSENFEKIPGIPVAYWVSDKIFELFSSKLLGDYAYPKQGLATGDNERFLRNWYEVSFKKIGIGCCDRKIAQISKKKWFPCNKGGSYRKWFGNNDHLVNWEYDGIEIRNFKNDKGKLRSRPQNMDKYFREGMTWSTISSGKLSMRYSPEGFMFETKGSVCFPENYENLYYLLGLMNTDIVGKLLLILSPTLDYHEGPLSKLPVVVDKVKKDIVDLNVSKSILIARQDWDSFETSWDFTKHPLIQKNTHILDCYNSWKEHTESQFLQLKSNEEELNRIFIEIYGLEDELTPEVEEKDVTIARVYDSKDDIPESMKGNKYVLTKADVIKSFISYAVGCMLGRYSLDVEGLAYAGGEWDESKYSLFAPDADNIIPITDEEYFDDDIVARFIEFLKTVYGHSSLEENLEYIADALEVKGDSSREIIRNYFLKDFYKDHVKTYQKRPIYWMFDSGKANGFKALVYMHRYDEDTVGRVRTDYLHRTQSAIEDAMGICDVTIERSESKSEKSKAMKRKEKLVKQHAEIKQYDQAISHIANRRIAIDLDDGVKVNYPKFQGIEVAKEGQKTVKVDLLGKI